jgi:hypothetical protein
LSQGSQQKPDGKLLSGNERDIGPKLPTGAVPAWFRAHAKTTRRERYSSPSKACGPSLPVASTGALFARPAREKAVEPTRPAVVAAAYTTYEIRSVRERETQGGPPPPSLASRGVGRVFRTTRDGGHGDADT